MLSVLANPRTGLPAGSSEEQVFADQLRKFKHLDKALKFNKKILWAFRGGYGVDKIMLWIVCTDYSRVKLKIIIRCSDVTPFIVHFSQKYNWLEISAPMLKDFVLGNKSKASYASVLDFLNGKARRLKVFDLNPLNDKVEKCNGISGRTTGGSLTCLISLIRMQWQMKTVR